MKKFTLLSLLFVLLTINSCQKQETGAVLQRPSAPDPTQLDAFIKENLLQEGEFIWAWASEDMVWTALANSDNLLSVGYKPAGTQDVEAHLHEININNPEWKIAREAIWQLILESERKITPGVQKSDLLYYEDDVLPVIDVRILNPETITLLRQSANLRYAEPLGYEPFMTNRAADRSGSGCDSNYPDPGLVAGVDYTNITPGCKASWNYSYHNIQQAWDNSTGSSVGLVIVDTGCSDWQDNLGDEFNQGDSQGRSITKLVTLPQATNWWGNPVGSPETPHDQCGHGTGMQGAAAAPRGWDGASAGIAYNCNLVSIRAAADVYLDESREVVGVSNAFKNAGNMAEIKIISMSMGRLTSASQIKDAIKYAYGKGKMIFCAAGTSFWWTSWFVGVIFPATMDEAIAVTGVKSNLTQRCSNCHSGSKVDFVLVMEKTESGTNPLTLAMEGDDPSTIGGSSVSTASTAGIAALVWAKYPGWSRQQVFDKMKVNSNYYPNRNSQFGWGRVNAEGATQ
ncbi:MAG: S8/S53 family peptidase [Lewinellaceae bacterium]|nr:S8/S53 family peptidase [Lewinellaceae bacterium]